MKILQIIYESFGSPFGFGGAGVRAYEIYQRLSARHEITLLSMKYPGARSGELLGLRHIFVGGETLSLTRSVLSYTVGAARFVSRHGRDFDIIVENFLPSTPFFSTFFTKTPVVLQVQGIMERHSFKKFNLLYSLPMYLVERFYPAVFDKFIFVSDVTREKVMKTVKRKAKVCRVIPNGIDRRLLEGEPAEGDYILFFSRIDRYTKGLDILLSAFEELSARFPDIRLVLAGHEFDSFSGLTEGLSVSLRKKIEYAGFLTGEAKVTLLSGARVVVLPSRHESAPISVLEAAACGKPLVVSNIPELHFVEANGFGLSFPSGSADGLKKKIELLLDHDGLRRDLGRQGREFAGRFLWDEIAAEFENTLQSIRDGN